tara:strand:- start:3936 stop:5003 length:1068 start_codon:yes stop_codon:yes gene_type:complete
MNLNFYTSLSETGYGIAGYNIINALLKKNITVATFMVGGRVCPDCPPSVVESVKQSCQRFDNDAPFVKLWHQFDLINRVGRGPYLGWPIFELDQFNDHELLHLKVPDELIVCSNWAADVLKDNGFINVHTVPLGVDNDIFYPSGIHNESGPYKFYTAGKWETRKGHDILINCFSKAFELTDNVELHLLTHNPFLDEQQTQYWTNLCKSSKLANKIRIYDRVESQSDVAEFMHQCDCGVFPSRAEGWNLELLESMACGKPVITTNNTAHKDYCNSDNARLIETPNKELAHDNKWFFGQGNWAEFDLDEEEQLIHYMKECYRDRPDNPGGLDTAKQFSWDNSSNILTGVLNGLTCRV